MLSREPDGILYVDPWAHDLVPQDEYAGRILDRACYARSWRYRLARRWRGIRHRVWEPTADDLCLRAERVARGDFAP